MERMPRLSMLSTASMNLMQVSPQISFIYKPISHKNNPFSVSSRFLILPTSPTRTPNSYENPFVTATSRSLISDIHRLARQLSSIDIPRPLATVYTLFGLALPKDDVNVPLFQALRVWNEIGDICECESFGTHRYGFPRLSEVAYRSVDGHRKTIVEHTLNILLLPGIHHDGLNRHQTNGSTDSLVNTVTGSPVPPIPHFALPSLPVPGTSLSVPSPLHFRLRILTRLSFNEQGCVTHHRDFWDVKDLMGLVPGVSLVQWITSRLTGAGLSYAARLLPRRKPQSYTVRIPEDGRSVMASDFSPSVRFGILPSNTLGLEDM